MGDNIAFLPIMVIAAVGVVAILAAIAARSAMTRTLASEARVAKAITNWWTRTEGRRVPGAGSEPDTVRGARDAMGGR